MDRETIIKYSVVFLLGLSIGYLIQENSQRACYVTFSKGSTETHVLVGVTVND